jgi:hypothetical protein
MNASLTTLEYRMSSPSSPTHDRVTFEVAGHVVSRVIQGRALVLDAQRDEIQQLNEVGSHLWALLLEGGHSVTSLATSLTEEFEVALPEAVDDVEAFLSALSERGLLSQVALGSSGSSAVQDAQGDSEEEGR